MEDHGTNRPSRSSATRSWLDYLDALRDALSAAAPQEAFPLRSEITIAKNELLRRGLRLRALEVSATSPTEPPETFSPLPWDSLEVQKLFGQAPVKTGQKSNRPSRSGATRPWLDYLEALRDALSAASPQEALPLRFEVTIAENELVRRGLPLRALELPDSRPEPPETFSPRPWDSPEAQLLFGQALVKTGQKYKDERLLRMGWALQMVARQQSRGEPELRRKEGMKLPHDCPQAPTPWQQMLSEPTGTTPCCLADGRALMLGNEEPLCSTIQHESEVYRFVWRSSFNGNAVVRIHRQGDAIALGWRYDWFRAPAPEDAPAEAPLSSSAWDRLQDALIAVNFWALDPVDEQRGLDGANWLIEGRRGNVYRGVSRWSPQGEFPGLGRLFFALAGSPLAKVKLY